MTNPSNSDPSSNIPNVTPPSNNQHRRRKRTRIANNETVSSSSPRPKPVKKPDTDTPNTAQTCTECGKQFSSLKALFGHMRCHPERQWRGINPPPNNKRGTTTTATSSSLVSGESEEDQNIASYLLMLVSGGDSTGSSEVEGRFECGVCKKVFASHQALGRHRATHKNVTNVTEDPPPRQEIVDQDKNKSVKLVSGFTHRCHICSRVFLCGQALGGHMRCHFEKDHKENQDGAIDLNVPASTSADTSLGCSLDLKLGL